MGDVVAFGTRSRLSGHAIAPPTQQCWRESDSYLFVDQVGEDFFFLAQNIGTGYTALLRERFAEMTIYVTETLRCEFHSPPVRAEREVVRSFTMPQIAKEAFESTSEQWTERLPHFGALVSEYHERIHRVSNLW